MTQKQIEKIHKSIESVEEQLEKIKEQLKKVEEEGKKDELKDAPGVEGVFDGVCIVMEDGKKHEVPANYAAKSRLVCGDKLKMMEEGGKTLFKQVTKVDRKKTEGIISKKEGKWYVLTDYGSYRISDTASEFNKLRVGDRVNVLVPEKDRTAAYAALDKVLSERVKEEIRETKKEVKKAPPKKIISKTKEVKEIEIKKDKEFVAELSPSKTKEKVESPKEEEKGFMLEDDDLR